MEKSIKYPVISAQSIILTTQNTLSQYNVFPYAVIYYVKWDYNTYDCSQTQDVHNSLSILCFKSMQLFGISLQSHRSPNFKT